MLDLVRLTPRPLPPSGGPEHYRQLAHLAGLKAGEDLLAVPCGSGASVELLVREQGAQGSGVDPDLGLVEEARRRAKAEDLEDRLQYEAASPDNLPYRDEVFDVVIGEVGLTAGVAAAEAARELVRVTRPGGRVILVQPVWRGAVDAERRRRVSEQMGVHTLLLTEWKAVLREAGLEQLHSESWSGEGPGGGTLPFPDFVDLLGVREKIAVVRRAWSRWGARGVYRALVREAEVHQLLRRERLLGVSLMLGTRTAVAMETEGLPGISGSDPTWEGPGPAPQGTASPSLGM